MAQFCAFLELSGSAENALWEVWAPESGNFLRARFGQYRFARLTDLSFFYCIFPT